MKAWYVTMEAARAGVSLRREGDSWLLGPGVPVTGDSRLFAELESLNRALGQRAQGHVGFLPELDRQSPTGHTISEGWVSPPQAWEALRTIKNRGWPIGDVLVDRDDPESLFVPLYSPRRRCGEALVYLAPTALDPESIKFNHPDGTSQEVPDLRNGGTKVVKTFAPGFGPGCEVLHQRQGMAGPELLVRMARGASFRISRAPDPEEPNAPEEVVVIWTGGGVKLQPSKRRSLAPPAATVAA